MSKLSSYDFYIAWKKFDKDGSGYIEEKELPTFLKEYMTTIGGISNPEAFTTKGLQELAVEFLNEHDRDRDGRINMEELATLLPTDQAFLLVFREKNPFVTAQNFMDAWRKYDNDKSGAIDSMELKGFLTEIYGKNVDDAKLQEYATSLLKIFDINHDGKLSLPELAQLLPIEENFLRGAFKKAGLTNLNRQKAEQLFDQFDTSGDGELSTSELKEFCTHVVKENTSDSSTNIVLAANALAEALSIACDENNDGRLDKSEVVSVLVAISKA